MHLYIHVPFCRQACYYCDFHFSTSMGQMDAVVAALAAEIRLTKGFLPNAPLQTVYFGGGTPSLLQHHHWQRLWVAIREEYTLAADAEITVEANPDDLTPALLARLEQQGVNRLSIGIQSFYEPHLQVLHRVHTATQAAACVGLARQAGINNVSIDLIYGIPASDPGIWQADVQQALSLGVGHISAYCLTIEPGTVFGNWLKHKKISPVDESLAAGQYEVLVAALAAADYEHYEISNFARPGCRSRHNTAYWQQKPYLGIGPSAHSFDGAGLRRHNVAHNARYVTALAEGQLPATTEALTAADRYNEYLLTGLRTAWGCQLQPLMQLFPGAKKNLEKQLNILRMKDFIEMNEHSVRVRQAARLFTDRIVEELFWVG